MIPAQFEVKMIPRSLNFSTLEIDLYILVYQQRKAYLKNGYDYANLDLFKNNSVSKLHCEMASRSFCISCESFRDETACVIVYSYRTPIHVQDNIVFHTRMGWPICVWDVPYAYGPTSLTWPDPSFAQGCYCFQYKHPTQKGLEEFTVLTRSRANRFCWALIDCT